MTPSEPQVRRPELDGLRGIAIALVVVSHVTSDIWMPATGAGPAGVRLFFVLSGFLITGILLRGPSFRSFYGRRARRLLPALALFLAAMAIVAVVAPLILSPNDILVAASYVSNWLLPADARLGHMWSLAVEEQFYLVWPLLLAVSLRFLGLRRTGWLTLIAVAGLGAWRVVLGADATFGRVYLGTDTNAAALLVGALLAMVPWAPNRLLVVAAAAALLFVAVLPFAFTGLDVVWWATVVAAGVLVAAAARTEIPVLRLRPLMFLGLISYGLYLWHYPLMHSPLGPLAGFALALAIAAASWWWWERRWLEPRRQTNRLITAAVAE